MHNEWFTVWLWKHLDHCWNRNQLPWFQLYWQCSPGNYLWSWMFNSTPWLFYVQLVVKFFTFTSIQKYKNIKEALWVVHFLYYWLILSMQEIIQDHLQFTDHIISRALASMSNVETQLMQKKNVQTLYNHHHVGVHVRFVVCLRHFLGKW